MQGVYRDATCVICHIAVRRPIVPRYSDPEHMLRPRNLLLAVTVSMHASGGQFLGPPGNEQQAYHALLAIHRCARDYVWGTDAPIEPDMRRVHAEYPHDLTQLGPTGARCLGGDLSHGKVDGWQITYQALVDASGHATGYELRATSEQSSRPSTLQFYSVVHAPEGAPTEPIDRNAIVHVRTDGQRATESDSVYGSPLPNVGLLLDCMRTPHDPKHSWVLELEQVKGCVPATSFTIRPDTDFAGRSTARTWGPGFDYTIVYSPVWIPGACDDPGEECGRGVADIQLDVRPTTYGVTGIRSYYVTDGGVVSGDWENTATVSTGRSIPQCEISHGTRCSAPRRWPRVRNRR